MFALFKIIFENFYQNGLEIIWKCIVDTSKTLCTMNIGSFANPITGHCLVRIYTYKEILRWYQIVLWKMVEAKTVNLIWDSFFLSSWFLCTQKVFVFFDLYLMHYYWGHSLGWYHNVVKHTIGVMKNRKAFEDEHWISKWYKVGCVVWCDDKWKCVK